MVEHEESTIGLYVHIPFCLRRCGYCSFFSRDDSYHLVPRYLAALQHQIRSEARGVENLKLATLFFGGGTPSLLPADDLIRLLAEIRAAYSMISTPEISIEVNPATLAPADLQRLREAGFNRISIGIQSFVDEELMRLGRVHAGAQGKAMVQAARHAGFDTVSLDLMYGLPGQTVESWMHSLEQALALKPEHLSVYELTVEEGTPFFSLQANGSLVLPKEEEVLLMHDTALRLIREAGLQRYEISNYAAPGHSCRHNLIYWHNGPCLGLGAGAVSYLNNCRSRAVASIPDYCRRIEEGGSPWIDSETLDQEARFRESVVMGLRLIEGIDPKRFRQRFGIELSSYYGDRLVRLQEQGLVEWVGGRLRLSRSGLLLANQVLVELV